MKRPLILLLSGILIAGLALFAVQYFAEPAPEGTPAPPEPASFIPEIAPGGATLLDAPAESAKPMRDKIPDPGRA